jgi:hypothetical protein
MRTHFPALFFLAAACAGGAPSMPELIPNWSGPAVHCRHATDRSLTLELVAPTGGHTFELVRVDAKGTRADVHLVHRGPGDRMVTQVITTLPVTVPADRLGGARSVFVWIAGQAQDRGALGPEQLAIATARP